MNNPADPCKTAPEQEGRPIVPAADLLSHVGRYRIERAPGRGRLRSGLPGPRRASSQRLVAVKVPHPHLIVRPEDADAYLAEARTAAGLDHPDIVPVFDVGRTADCPCFVVSKFIEGQRPGAAIRDDRPVAGRGGGAGRDGRRGAAPRPPAGHRPPRRQAGQHPARRGRPALRRRLRPGPAGGGRRPGPDATPARRPT